MAETLTMKKLQEQIDFLKEEVANLKSLGKNTRIVPDGLKIGDTFELAGLDWKILDITENGYMCLAEKLEDDMKFDSSCNNWQASDLRNWLNVDFFKKLAEVLGEENIIPFERDLISLDGQTEYGICEDKVSLLTVDEYRKYRKLIPNTDDYWWWTITPDSTKCNGDSRWVLVVHPSGYISRGDFYNCGRGVRPVCIFSSSIFESEE